jgi:tRNA pseudouridine38-40 synthase
MMRDRLPPPSRCATIGAVRTLKLTLAYDGGAYVGWQRQATGTSIQGLLEDAVARIDGQPVTITGAGRTDAGVHAIGQVASVDVVSSLACDAYARALNAVLPIDVRVRAVEEAPSGFHARFAARAKTYRYRLLLASVVSPFEARYAWHVTHALDRSAMREALEACRGRHDFAAFQSTGTDVRDTVRTITDARFLVADAGPRANPGASAPAFWGEERADARPGASSTEASLAIVELTGDGFLRHMVRAIVGTLVDIGRGRWPAAEMAEIVASRDRARAGPTAPAHGLFLVAVQYGGAD